LENAIAVRHGKGGTKFVNPLEPNAITAIKAALAQPAQEPVAWAIYDKRGGSKSLHWPENHSPDGDATKFDAVPLYTTPPQPAQEPVARVSGVYGGMFVVEPLNPATILPVGMALYAAPKGNT
jgi:hypothetical protein